MPERSPSPYGGALGSSCQVVERWGQAKHVARRVYHSHPAPQRQIKSGTRHGTGGSGGGWPMAWNGGNMRSVCDGL